MALGEGFGRETVRALLVVPVNLADIAHRGFLGPQQPDPVNYACQRAHSVCAPRIAQQEYPIPRTIARGDKPIGPPDLLVNAAPFGDRDNVTPAVPLGALLIADRHGRCGRTITQQTIGQSGIGFAPRFQRRQGSVHNNDMVNASAYMRRRGGLNRLGQAQPAKPFIQHHKQIARLRRIFKSTSCDLPAARIFLLKRSWLGAFPFARFWLEGFAANFCRGDA